jgi:hypothetical protein
MKKIYTIFTLVLYLGAFVAVMTACAPSNLTISNLPSNQENIELNDETIAPTVNMIETPVIPGITVQAINKYAQTNATTRSAAGIEVSVANFRFASNEILVDACYQLPDESDWTIDKATIITNDFSILNLSGGTGIEFTRTLSGSTRQLTTFEDNKILVTEFTADPNLPNYRCDTLSFGPIGDRSNISHLILTIHSLIAIPGEGSECQALMNRIQPVLEAHNGEFQINCAQEIGGTKISIVLKPDSMSLEEAEGLIAEYLKPEIYEGEWKFEGEIK